MDDAKKSIETKDQDDKSSSSTSYSPDEDHGSIADGLELSKELDEKMEVELAA